MKPITQADIDEMKRDGCVAAAIHRAEAQLAQFQQGLVIADEIRTAFRGVALGNGIGLSQARGIDDYAEPPELKKLRAADEKQNWERIPVSELGRCNSSLSFFDAAGMRFHLPAYLIADLKGECEFGLEFHLMELNDDSLAKFSLLNRDQRRAVHAYLQHCLATNGHQKLSRKEQSALNYWAGLAKAPDLKSNVP